MRVNSPASRRAILGALAVAPVAVLSPLASPTLAGEPHPDAVLLVLCAEYEAAERDYLDLVEQFDEIDNQADATRPPLPDALRRTDDFRHFYGRAASPTSPIFYTPEECQRFRGYVPQGHEQREDREAARARAAAIVAAYDTWSEASEQHDITSGLNAAEDRCTEAFEPLCALKERVLALRPATLDGAAAKARVWDLCRDAKLAAAICADLMAMRGAA